jgi:hypothetical protein
MKWKPNGQRRNRLFAYADYLHLLSYEKDPNPQTLNPTQIIL